MATIKEDYVSFEIAKLLKEKRFDEYCPLWYNLDKPIEGPFFYREIGWYGHNSYDYNGKRIVSAPTLQMAMKWLREVHNIYYEIQLLLGDKAAKYGDLQLGVYKLSSSGAYSWKCWLYADTYEELYEKYIKYCLENLI